jgi:hypothetical protein
MSVTVPVGWYGAGDDRSFCAGQGFDSVAEEFRDAVLCVDVLSMPLATAASRFAKLRGLSSTSHERTHFAGRAATVFHAHANHGHVVLDTLGANADIGTRSEEQIFVQAGAKTVLLRSELPQTKSRAALRRVLNSVRFG